MARCSVIIPAFNVAEYVGDAVRSALDQTYIDREVIVVDDGSTDGTAEALEPYLDRIEYVRQKHKGVAAARNRGLELAHGELVALLDADDVWFPFWLERSVAFLDERPELDIVAHPLWLVLPRWRRFHTADQAFWITQYNFMSYMCVLYRRLFDQHGGYDEALGAYVDWELWIRFLGRGARAGEFPGTLAAYRRRDRSVTADLGENLRNELRMFERVMAKTDEPTAALAARLEIARGRAALADGESARARRHLARGARSPEMALSTRLQSIPFLVAPRLSRRVQARIASRRAERFVRRQRTRS